MNGVTYVLFGALMLLWVGCVVWVVRRWKK